MFKELAVLVEMFDGVGVVGAWVVHELVEVVRQSLLGLLARAISSATNAVLSDRRRSFLFFLPLCVEGPSSWSMCLALPLSRPPLKTALTTSSSEAWLVAASSRLREVRGFKQPSLWIRDSQVVPERNALMMSVSTMSGREMYHWENLRM